MGRLKQAQQAEGNHGDIELHLHGVLAASEEGFYFQVLLDPLEEKFNLPTFFIKFGNHDLAQFRVIEPVYRAANPSTISRRLFRPAN